MDARFREYDPSQPLLLPPDLRDWVPASHLASFLFDLVADLDLSKIYTATGSQAKGGRPAYHPLLMVRLLLYGYCTGTYSSRKLERKTYDDIAVRFLTADQHPDHDTIAAFRQKHLNELAGLFLQVLLLCKEAGLVKLGHVAIDGTKVKANASKHKAMSYERMTKEEKRLEHELAELKATAAKLLVTAQGVDADEDKKYGKGNRGDELPAELARRESRLRVIREAKARVEARARAEAQRTKKADHSDGEDDSGPEPPAAPGGSAPSEEVVPDPKAQSNFTDPESRIMLDGATKGYAQAYNGQLAVDGDHQIIVAAELTQAASDINQLVPVLEAVKTNCGDLPRQLTADAGYCSEENLSHPEVRSVDVHVSTTREKRSGLANAVAIVSLAAITIGELMFGRLRARRFSVSAKKLYKLSFATTLVAASVAGAPVLIPLRFPTEREKMRHKLQTPEAKAVYARRKAIVEPVNGQIKEARGFRRFSMRGYAKCRAEWSLVAAAHNLLKLFKARAVCPGAT